MIRWTPLALGLIGLCASLAPAHAAVRPPANVCVELVNWIDQQQAKNAGKTAGETASKPAPGQAQTASKPPPPGAAPSSAPPRPPPGAAPGAPPAQQQGGQQGGRDINTAVEQARPVDPQRPGGQDEPQKTSGISGPVTAAGPGAAGPQGAAQERSQSGSVNPEPDIRQGASRPAASRPAEVQPVEPKDRESALQLEQARRGAEAGDIQECNGIVRKLRIAGVAVPPPLIALAALRNDYELAPAPARQPAPRGPAPGVPPIPPSGIPAEPPLGAAPPPGAEPR